MGSRPVTASPRSLPKSPHRLDACKAKGQMQMPEQAGRVGLKNLGNTCFMNAGLQCLVHLDPLVEYFFQGLYQEDLERGRGERGERGESSERSERGAGTDWRKTGEVAESFAALLREIWESPSKASAKPKDIHGVFRRRAPFLFKGYEQQDVQEFLAFLLDALHEDLNLVRRKPPPMTDEMEKEDDKLAQAQPEERREEVAAALAWRRYLERGKSFLVDLLQGQLKNALTCSTCGHESRKFEPFLYLSIPVSRTMTRLTDAVEKFLEDEVLSGDDGWMCPKCKQKVNATKTISLWKLPPVLVLHLKRFEFNMASMHFHKIDTALSTRETIDLSSYVQSPQKEKAKYDVVGVANHVGRFGSGHYTADCKVKRLGGDAAWYHFDDELVTAIDRKSIVSKDAYVIFLRRRAELRRGIIPRQSISKPDEWPHDFPDGLPPYSLPDQQRRSRLPPQACSIAGAAAPPLSPSLSHSPSPLPGLPPHDPSLSPPGGSSVSSSAPSSGGSPLTPAPLPLPLPPQQQPPQPQLPPQPLPPPKLQPLCASKADGPLFSPPALSAQAQAQAQASPPRPLALEASPAPGGPRSGDWHSPRLPATTLVGRPPQPSEAPHFAADFRRPIPSAGSLREAAAGYVEGCSNSLARGNPPFELSGDKKHDVIGVKANAAASVP